MNDVVTSLVIFGILVAVAWFVHYKAGKAGGFGRWLWMAFFGASSAFLVYVGFNYLVHYQNPVLKMFMLFIILAIVCPIAGFLGGFIYDKRS